MAVLKGVEPGKDRIAEYRMVPYRREIGKFEDFNALKAAFGAFGWKSRRHRS
jgi:hypothetical protein